MRRRKASDDPRVLLRIDGKIYEGQLVRIESGTMVEALLAKLSRKYALGRRSRSRR
jgi:hypothetical protein